MAHDNGLPPDEISIPWIKRKLADMVFIELDFGTAPIRGHLHVYESHACVTVYEWPKPLDVTQARTALLHAVKDGRIKVPDSAAIAMDLIGMKPRVA